METSNLNQVPMIYIRNNIHFLVDAKALIDDAILTVPKRQLPELSNWPFSSHKIDPEAKPNLLEILYCIIPIY